MNNHNPKVSVIIPSYNHEAYVEQAILSILNQTYQDFELIVVDDGSKDNSPEIIQRLTDGHGFIFIRQQNKGLVSTLNAMLAEYVQGEYLGLCASDDFWHPEKLKKQIAVFEDCPSIDLCHTNAEVVDANGAFMRKENHEEMFGSKWKPCDLFVLCNVVASSTMVKVSTLREIGGYDPRYRIEDMVMLYKFVLTGARFHYLDETMCYIRRHDFNWTHASNADTQVKEHKRIIQDILPEDIMRRVMPRHKLRWFYVLASKHKFKSLKYLPSALRYCYTAMFWRGIVRFFIR